MAYFHKLIINLKNKGIKQTFMIVCRFLINKFNVISFVRGVLAKKKVYEFLGSKSDKQFIVFYHVSGWGGALKQRPHHVATELVRRGYEYVYPAESFFVSGKGPAVSQVPEGVNTVNSLKHFLDYPDYKKKLILHLWSTNYTMTPKLIESFKKKFHILYEYVDEVDEAITGTVQKKYADSHEMLLKDPGVSVVCTAYKLYEDAVSLRGSDKNIRIASNGVFEEDFQVEFGDIKKTTEKFKELVSSGVDIIGYYGALASWVDFKLLESLAERFPDKAFVLIGNDYDGSFAKSKLLSFSNVHVFPPVEYQRLKDFGKFFNVGLIPFKINEVTESTSPVKLFEYMAMGLPIVSTKIRECEMYESVLIGKDYENFADKIIEGISLKNNNEWIAKLKSEAFANTWEKKVDVIQQAVEGIL